MFNFAWAGRPRPYGIVQTSCFDNPAFLDPRGIALVCTSFQLFNPTMWA